MSKWELEPIIKAIDAVPDCTVIKTSPDEDYTTTQLTIRVNNSGYMIYVRGFVTEGQPIKDNMVEMIEVTTGFSDGDMPNDPDYVVAHAKVKAAIMRLGYSVVNSMEPYF